MTAEDGRLRPVDLARAVGISTQQVRNYEQAGILPPAPRAPSGHRRFDARHRGALLTYRSLAPGYGWDTAREIMRAVHAGELPAALALLDAGHAALHEQRLSLRATVDALEAVAEQDLPSVVMPRWGLRIGEVAAQLRVRTSALRVWEAAGLLAPTRDRATGYRRFTAADVRDARMVDMLRRGHYPLPQIRVILDGLRETGSSDALRAAVARRHADLAGRSAAMLRGSCDLRHYLSGGDAPAPP